MQRFCRSSGSNFHDLCGGQGRWASLARMALERAHCCGCLLTHNTWTSMMARCGTRLRLEWACCRRCECAGVHTRVRVLMRARA